MLALALYEADKCPGCGHPWSEATLPGREDHWETDAIRCHACTDKAITRGLATSTDYPEAVHHMVREVISVGEAENDR